MSTTIFPQNGDTGGETAFQKQMREAIDYSPTVPRTGERFGIESTSGLDITLGDGMASVGGVWVEVTSSTTVTAPDNATRYLVLKVTRNSGLVASPTSDDEMFDFVTGTEIPSTTAFSGDTNPEDYLPLFEVTTSGGAITAIRDLRKLHPGPTVKGYSISVSKTSDTTVAREPQIYAPCPWSKNSATTSGSFVVEISGGFGSGGFRWKFNLSGNQTWTAFDLTNGTFAGAGSGASDTEQSVTGTGSVGLVRVDLRFNFASDPQVAELLWAQDTSNATATSLGDYRFILGNGREEGEYI